MPIFHFISDSGQRRWSAGSRRRSVSLWKQPNTIIILDIEPAGFTSLIRGPGGYQDMVRIAPAAAGPLGRGKDDGIVGSRTKKWRGGNKIVVEPSRSRSLSGSGRTENGSV